MKTIVVMFDSLNRQYLPAYGADWTDLPNFRRLQARTVTFDTCYGGSMPCMPARREMHTGRYNFLHRSWGPIEPFDDSVPEMLKTNGVYTHLVTDHAHYWEDGGATYHGRFSSHEFFRGQEGDRWKGHIGDPEIPETVSWRGGNLWRQDWINRLYLDSVERHPQTLTFDAGIAFIETNRHQDRWLLQIETFDPHEPFFSYDEHKARYPHDYRGPHFDWPDYRPVIEDEATIEHARKEYVALLSMCDDSLGRVLDAMDAYDMWDDTMLIVCTDHGFLLGERNWWGKNVQPWYEENIHTPLFVWDPRAGDAGGRRQSLVQTIDLGPTLLEFFGLKPTEDMQGRPLRSVLESDTALREAGLFGSYGGHVCVTDGRYVYMRACAEMSNEPLEEFTLMPTHMCWRFQPSELQNAALSPPFSFTKNAPVLKLGGRAMGNPIFFGTLIYDLKIDPGQTDPINDPELEMRLAEMLVAAMRANDAPESQFVRLGLPIAGPVTEAHLQVEKQWHFVAASEGYAHRDDRLEDYGPAIATPLTELLANPEVADLFAQSFGFRPAGPMLSFMGHLNPWQVSIMVPGVSSSMVHDFDRALQKSGSARTAGRAS